MRYKLLGSSGLRVSEICLGAMGFGEEWGWGAAKDESRRIFDTFVEKGGNFIDTANIYTGGTSEKFLGEFIAPVRERLVVATKYTISMNKEDPNSGGNHRKNMMQSIDASLKRLNTSYVDLYWVHAWDFLTPLDEIMRGLDDLVKSGKVLYVGISDTPAWIVSQANMLAELRGWSRFVALQIEYSLIERTVERELIPMAQALDLAVTAWAPLAGGVLSGKYNDPKKERGRIDAKRSPSEERLSERSLRIAREVAMVAKECDRSAVQVALNWLRQQQALVIPIVGVRTREQLLENLACLDFHLTDEQMERLNEVSQIEGGFPHDFLQRKEIRQLVYGKTESHIDNHRLARSIPGNSSRGGADG